MDTPAEGPAATDLVIRLLVDRGVEDGPETVVLVEVSSAAELQRALREVWNLGFVVTSLRVVAEV